MMPSFSDIQISIFYKLWRNRCFGKGHMLIDTVANGFPTDVQQKVKHEIDTLVKRKYLVKKPSKNGYYVHINLKQKQKIENAIKTIYSFYLLFDLNKP